MAIISTSITKEQLDDLVANNKLQEGLQYKIVNRNNLIVLAISSSVYKPLISHDKIEFLLTAQLSEINVFIPVQYMDQSISVVQDAPNKRWVVTKTPSFNTQKTHIVQITNGGTPVTSEPVFFRGYVVNGGPDSGQLIIYITDNTGAYKGNDYQALQNISVSVNSY